MFLMAEQGCPNGGSQVAGDRGEVGSFGAHLKVSTFITVCALYFGSVLNLSLWRYTFKHIQVNSWADALFGLSLPLVIFLGLFGFFSLVVWPYGGKLLVAFLLTISSMANYFMFHFGIFIESDMMTNVFQTNTREAFDLISLNWLIWVGLTGVLPAALLPWVKIQYKPFWKEIGTRILILICCLAVLGGLTAGFYKTYAAWGRNNKNVTRLINPFNYMHGTIRYFQRQALLDRKFVELDENASHLPYDEQHPTVLVLVVGETARAANFSLNGYERVTNPLLSQQKVLSFTDVASCGTATAVSLPCLFSHLTRNNFEVNEANYTENLMDLLQAADYKILWLENDDGCKKVCDRVPTRDMVEENQAKFCDGEYCYDEVLLGNLDEYVKTITQDTVIVLHTMGSHGPSYHKRYPEEFKKFQPTCDTNDIQSCSRESIVNTYDNTILYTDHIISAAIDILKKYPKFESGLIYVSDHGESLGENNVYLHGLPYSIAPLEQTRVPLIMWLSDLMVEADHLDYQCLKSLTSAKFSHDNFFHSILGLMEISSTVYDEKLDIFSPCLLKP